MFLQVQGEHGLDPTTEAGISRLKDEKDKLSNILNVLNDKYGTEFTDADKLYFDQIDRKEYLFKDVVTILGNQFQLTE